MRRPLRLGGYPYHLASDRQLHLGGPRLLRSYVRAIAALEETGPLTAGAWESARERRRDVRSRCGVRPVTGRDTETDPPPRAKDERGPRRLRRPPSDLPHSKLPGGRVPGRDQVLNRVFCIAAACEVCEIDPPLSVGMPVLDHEVRRQMVYEPQSRDTKGKARGWFPLVPIRQPMPRSRAFGHRASGN